MQRVKDFQATGVAPLGKMYAGDLNGIQDAAAALTDFAQTLSVGSVRVGDATLSLSKFGAGEGQFSGALRASGLLRGLGGIIAGSFTTAQRDAIALNVGLAPYGTVILNTTTGQYEWNSGTDAARAWIPMGTVQPPGTVVDYAGAAAPAGWLLCDGASLLRATYAALFTAIGVAYGSVDGTHFNVPDFRGRTAVGLGTHADVDALGDSDGIATVANRRPKHKHTVSLSHTHVTGREVVSLTPGGTAYSIVGNAGTRDLVSDATVAGTVGPQTGAEPTDSAGYLVINKIIKA